MSSSGDNDREAVYCRSQSLYSTQDIDSAIDRIGTRMNADLSLANPVILVVMTGALVFAGQLLPRLRFPLELDYCQVSRYRTGGRGERLEWRVRPSIDLAGRAVVVVDDIYDEGTTLLEIVSQCRALGAAAITSCVMVDKDHDRKADRQYSPDYAALRVEDQFLVGFGMDYKGHGRNMPGIYAVGRGSNG